MKRTLFTLLLAAGIISCHAQQETKTNKEAQDPPATNQPVTSWKVNKKFDDKGNLISYDSTYSYSYSSTGNSADADSLVKQWQQQWNTQFNFSGFFQPSFHMFSDSFFHSNMLPGIFSQRTKQFKNSAVNKRNVL